jgi:dephospho-CoA kinase
MLVIALTGGIGSGKTTVSEIFKSKNIPVIDTDLIARELVEKGKPAYKKIIDTFGEKILAADNEIDRKHLREIIFSSEQSRIQLEEILHPLI